MNEESHRHDPRDLDAEPCRIDCCDCEDAMHDCGGDVMAGTWTDRAREAQEELAEKMPGMYPPSTGFNQIMGGMTSSSGVLSQLNQPTPPPTLEDRLNSAFEQLVEVNATLARIENTHAEKAEFADEPSRKLESMGATYLGELLVKMSTQLRMRTFDLEKRIGRL